MASVWSAPPRPHEEHRRAWDDPPDPDVSADLRRHLGDLRRVLDAGCGGGQAMAAYRDAALRVGLDSEPQALAVAREMFSRLSGAPPALLRARLEAVPLRAGILDLVLCRLVLPYTDNRAALAELARVLRPGGGVLLIYHDHRFYLRKLAAGARAGDLRPVVYGLRVLLSGLVFQWSGRQLSIFGKRETYLTPRHLARLAAAVGLEPVLEFPDSSVPKVLLRRRS